MSINLEELEAAHALEEAAYQEAFAKCMQGME